MMADGMRAILAAVCLSMPALLGSATTSLAKDAIRHMAPDFTRTDIKGTPVVLHEYRGKVVLLNFWATWCGPCLAEIPIFAGWQSSYGTSGLQIVGVSMDDDVTKIVQAYLKYHLNYPVIMGDAELGERFGGVFGLPLSYVIDPEGGLVGRYQGGRDLRRLESQIKSLLSISD